MEATIRYLGRAGVVFKLLALLAIMLGFIQLLLVLFPSIGATLIQIIPTKPGASLEDILGSAYYAMLFPTGRAVSSLEVVWLIITTVFNTVLVSFGLYTGGVVLDFLAGLGEDMEDVYRALSPPVERSNFPGVPGLSTPVRVDRKGIPRIKQ